MLIKMFSEYSREKLSIFGFQDEQDINEEMESGDALGYFSFTPLMYAAYHGDLILVKELVKAQVDL